MEHLNIATESIAFQTGLLYKELTAIFKDCHSVAKHTEESLNAIFTRVSKVTLEHTGISTMVQQYPGSDNAFVLIPALAKGHVLNNVNFNQFLGKYFDIDKSSFHDLEKKGWLDPVNSRVGGAFSEIIFKVFMSDVFIKPGKYTAEEVASVYLHEVGHAYTFIQFVADSVIVSHVLQRTQQELMGGNADGKVKILLTKAAEDVRLTERDWIQVVKEDTDKTAAFNLLVTAVALGTNNRDGKQYFTKDASEELADIFAFRHRAGKALLTARSKFPTGSMTIFGTGDVVRGVFLVVAAVVSAPLSGGVGIFMGILGATITAWALEEAATVPDVHTFKYEAQKIRNQFVEILKQSKLPKEDVAEAIDGIETADKLIQNYKKDVDPTLLVRFMDMFRRGKMDQRATREYLTKLEDLSANDLFIRSAELRLGNIGKFGKK